MSAEVTRREFLATVAAALLIANIVAALPARAAARLRPAESLRTE